MDDDNVKNLRSSISSMMGNQTEKATIEKKKKKKIVMEKCLPRRRKDCIDCEK